MSDLSSGKGHHDENFPVASWLVKREHRTPILTFYRFARAADDIADHPTAGEAEKLEQLERMRAGLTGEGAPEAMALAKAARERRLDLVHAHELLDAFVQDVTIRRYARWDDLIAYCRLSAMPVGRFVLDVHGEDQALWPLSDALCAALQVINHQQDCRKDFLALDRVYVPTDWLEMGGIGVDVLAGESASAELLGVFRMMARNTSGLLEQSAPFARAIRDPRLAAEVAVIQRLAEDLNNGLLRRAPLSENVHHSKLRAAWLALGAVTRLTVSRLAA